MRKCDGVGYFSIEKGTVDGCGYAEVWRDFIYIFSSEMFSHTYMGTDNRDLANGGDIYTYIYPYRYTSCHLLSYTYIH